MELPFAVESSPVIHHHLQPPTAVADSSASLVSVPPYPDESQDLLLNNQGRQQRVVQVPYHANTNNSSVGGTRTARPATSIESSPPYLFQKTSKNKNEGPRNLQSGKVQAEFDFERGNMLSKSPPNQQQPNEIETETIDFTSYVNVCETDADEVDVIIAAANSPKAARDDGIERNERGATPRGDVLAVLLSGSANELDNGEMESDSLVSMAERANEMAAAAAEAKKKGNLQDALQAHATAAKMFHDAALQIMPGLSHSCMRKSLFLLSQTQAKAAISLQRVIKTSPNTLQKEEDKSQKERLRAKVRGALDHKMEADMSDSVFLGRATKQTRTSHQTLPTSSKATTSTGTSIADQPASKQENTPSNPVDEMMALERELRDMDMALELGNSIASLDRASRMKSSTVGESFMVVPSGNQGASNNHLQQSSYMSSSILWNSPPAPSSGQQPPRNNNPTVGQGGGIAGVRARANRVQSILGASTSRPTTTTPQQQQQQQPPPRNHSLESSWWGSSSTTAASQVLTSSVISLATTASAGGGTTGSTNSQQPANTKQLMRLMDSLKTLGDENATLLREVEGAEAARREAAMAKEQMRKFKADYGKKYERLKGALEKFRKEYPQTGAPATGVQNPVLTSAYVQRGSSTLEQQQKKLKEQEELIRSLSADLKKEKDESKKKDAALGKYENFYREVKARSAQKAAQRQKEQSAQLQRQQHGRQQTRPPR